MGPPPSLPGGPGKEESAIAQAPTAAGGPLAFTFGNWFTWTAVGLAFPLLGLLLVAAAGPLARGAYETFPAFAATHVATLGWVTMTIMGASMQMAPVLLGARVRAERTIPWQFGLFSLSLIGCGDWVPVAAPGLGRRWRPGRQPGGVVVHRAHRPDGDVGRAAAGGHAAAHPGGAGVLHPGAPTLLAANLRWPVWPALFPYHRGLVVHLTLGLGGWFGLMVVGTFYRLVPLVHGARVASRRRGSGILALGALAITATMVGVAWGVGWLLRLAALAAAGALVLFIWEVVHVLERRRGHAPDLNVAHWHAVAAYSAVLACAGTGWGLGWLRSNPPDRLGAAVVVLFLLGWVTQAIIGQLYKITPFLMWYYRATIPDVLAIPRQPAPYNPRLGRVVLWLSNLGVAGLTTGIWRGLAIAAQGGALLLAAAAFVLAYLLAYRWISPAIGGTLAFEWRWRIS